VVAFFLRVQLAGPHAAAFSDMTNENLLSKFQGQKNMESIRKLLKKSEVTVSLIGAPNEKVIRLIYCQDEPKYKKLEICTENSQHGRT